MKLFKLGVFLGLSLVIATCFATGVEEQKKAMPTNFFADLKSDSFKLDGIIIENETQQSDPFAIMIGDFTVMSRQVNGKTQTFKLDGKGILINSSFIHKNIHTNKDVTYSLPASSEIKNGSKFSLFIVGNRNEEDATPIAYYKLYDLPHNQQSISEEN